MRAPALLVVPLLLVLLPAAPAQASGSLLPICTTNVIESVSLCIGPGECVTLFLGPSARTTCAPPVCTAALIESFGVCQDPATKCLYAWVGPGKPVTILCPPAASLSAGDVCTPTWGIPLTEVQACTTHDSTGAACAQVTRDGRVVVLACDPTLA